MTTRDTFDGDSEGVPWKDEGEVEGFGNQYARHVGNLYAASALPLTLVSGTNDLEASLDPVLPAGGLAEGMKFGITWPATNTGAMTLAINGGDAAAIVTAGGVAMTAGAAQAGARALLEFVGSDYRVLITGNTGEAGGGSSRETFTASGTWAKPADASDETVVFVEMWGGGGGGSSNGDDGGGGGGGAYAANYFTLGDLPETVAVTIGAGGGPDVSGGASAFGALLTAEGGIRGYSPSGGRGGGFLPRTVGDGGASTTVYVETPWSGGGGGQGQPGSGTSVPDADDGVPVVFGGGGGGGRSEYYENGDGGLSVLGGAGGDAPGGAGTAPGGGGGGNGGSGARGELRVYVLG